MELKVYIYTLGCRLNSLESEAIAESFIKSSCKIVKKIEDADLFIVNSCTVTSKAEQKARRMIRLFLKTAPVIVTGCYAQCQKEELSKLSSNVVVVSNTDKPKLLKVAEVLSKSDKISAQKIRDAISEIKDKGESISPFSFFPKDFTFHSRGMLKIQDGCDRFCSFCKTSIARGKPVSLPVDDVLERICQLQDAGVKEIVLTGVNLALYNYNGVNFSALLSKIVPQINPDVLIRTSSIEPDLIDDDFYNVIKDGRIAPHFHLPIQSVDKKVLSSCGRKYDKIALKKIVDGLRNSKGDPFISADIITGLPFEDDEAFLETYNFLKDEHFSYLHIFPFSPREGTKYATLPHPQESIRDRRALILRNLSDKLYDAYYQKYKGKTISAIAEDVKANRQYFTTSNYLKISKKITPQTPHVESGSRVFVTIE